MECNRCEGNDAVIDASAFCRECDIRTMICVECWYFHIQEIIDDLRYKNTMRRIRNGN